MPSTVQSKAIQGLSEVFGLYDGFILDLWGVVHDGVKPFPETIPVLQALKKTKKKVWLLSNAPRRAQIVANKLTEMGIDPALYDGILTSGEASREALQEKYLGKWGRRCIHIGSPTRDKSLFEGLDLEIVTDPAHANFVLNTGVADFSDTLDKYKPQLEACALRQLPMLCANPDMVVHIEEKLVICAGTLAAAYAEMEGEVVYFGKPYRGVYSSCLGKMGAEKVLAVGDSMLTDIAGATGVGLDCVLVTSGIHREELPEDVSPALIEKFLVKYPYRPNFIMSGFKW
jgi:HAD superfamily hydrolase (TIGR01459 family)